MNEEIKVNIISKAKRKMAWCPICEHYLIITLVDQGIEAHDGATFLRGCTFRCNYCGSHISFSVIQSSGEKANE